MDSESHAIWTCYIFLQTSWYWNWYITAEDVATSASVNLLVLWMILSPEVGALHPQQAEYKAQHAHGQSWHEEASHYLDVAWWRSTTQM